MKKLTQPAVLLALGLTVSTAAILPKTAELLSPLEKPQIISSDSTGKDSLDYPKFKDLPLKPEREVKFTTQEGTWMSVDVSPDGKTIAFDLMGDIYTIPMEGGKATPITTGMAYETHPRYSPDGKKILFTSDRAGSDNLWYIDMEKKDTVQVTKDKNGDVPGAHWTPDGKYIVVAKGRRISKLWMYHVDGGGGIQLNENPASMKTIDPFVSPDGEKIYFSWRTGAWNYNAMLPQYQIGTYDLDKGDITSITSRYGSAFTPTLSKDGKWMVYGSRWQEKTGLVIRDLSTGDEKWLAYPVQRDEQESIAPQGVLPAMAFTPDSKFVIASYGGKLWKLPVDGSAATEIPFEADVKLGMGPRLYFNYAIKDTTHKLATQIRDAVPSPDGKKLAFTALNRLYVMDYPSGTPKRVTKNEFVEAMPSWSPDGTQLVFVTWEEKNGGSIYKAAISGNMTTTKISSEAALYSGPVWGPKNRIVVFKGPKRALEEAEGPGVDGSEAELVWIPANGGPERKILDAGNYGNAHFTQDTSRIYLNSPGGTLLSIKWDGTDPQEHAKITGITPFGSAMDDHSDHGHITQDVRYVMGKAFSNADAVNYCMLPEGVSAREPQMRPASASTILMAPVGDMALAQVNNNVYVITIPKAGKTPSINVADPGSSNFPSRQLTEIGGEWPAWEANGKKVHWSLGNGHWVYDLDRAEFVEDSVKSAKKAKTLADADSVATLKAKGEDAVKLADSLAKAEKKRIDSLFKADKALAKADSTHKAQQKEKETYKPSENQVKVYFAKDTPKGSILLKNARIV
ncbi:MAG: amidohydrolase, partial [Cytophagales bacterium]